MPATYDKIQTYTVTGSAVSTVSFTSISSAYTDLVIAVNARDTSTAGLFRFNNDTSAAYNRTFFVGFGSSGSTSTNLGLNQFYWDGEGTGNTFSSTFIDINGYSQTAFPKVVQQRQGVPNISSAVVVGRWNNTSAINRIDFLSYSGGNDIGVGSTFTIYGILRA